MSTQRVRFVRTSMEYDEITLPEEHQVMYMRVVYRNLSSNFPVGTNNLTVTVKVFAIDSFEAYENLILFTT